MSFDKLYELVVYRKLFGSSPDVKIDYCKHDKYKFTDAQLRVLSEWDNAFVALIKDSVFNEGGPRPGKTYSTKVLP